MLALAVMTSAPVKPGASPGRGGMPYGDQGEREAAVRRSFSYMLVGGLLIALGVVLEALG